jgi:hypothetical protein
LLGLGLALPSLLGPLPFRILACLFGSGRRELARHIGSARRFPGYLRELLVLLRLLYPDLLQGVEQADG